MDLGYLKISRLPLKVFYDEDAVNSNKRLPSEQRNIDIIRGITFIKFLKLLKENNESNIKSWFYEHDNKLRKHLNKMQEKFKQKPHTKYCKNLNYILDFVVQAIDNLNDIKYARVKHEFDENSRNILQSYTSLNCLRDLRNSENKNLYIKKIMYDLLDDIEYMLSRQNNQIRAQCLKMFNRIKYRRGILGNIYNTVSDRSIFHSDKNCNLSIIAEKFSGLNCNKTPKVPQTVTVAEPQPVTELPSSEEDLLEPRASEDGEEPIDVGDLEISLPVNEDPPKLDTTYAAASLAGISLFGTILYKYRPFGLGSNLRRGARNGSNIFPLDNNVYDANIMNNFEYLQTGIPNDEYQLGYGSVTDY